MIKGFTTGTTGGYLNVNGSGYIPYISPNMNNPLEGVVRINGGNLEAMQGTSWVQLGGYADVNLSQAAIQALDWCQRKMIEEEKLKDLASKNVTVADALEQFKKAEEQLKIAIALTEEH